MSKDKLQLKMKTLLQVFLATALLTFLTTSRAESDIEQVSGVLDKLHSQASQANFTEYFNLYAPDAVFIGTDADEVWSISEFKAYAKPHFDKGTGWTYLPRDRHIYFSPDHQVAWFDELLDNKKLGETRGTGVLIKTDNQWKISQYHLTIPIPNNLATDIAEQIKKHHTKK
ncbi:nuclear transport factor 2 family protein [Alteromonas sp. MB-3u-76]|uniref:nuclear transport factor 2 family protein n=1 Tax=Alteromonas sp. MB-3u-76 TaxID=2058133 RepID=UPI001E552963|nr:nuclear transport factor 2 family protein [Alteromonas sp. MB-3u-76]